MNRALRLSLYGVVLGAAIAKGPIASMDTTRAEAACGVLAVVTASNVGKLDKGEFHAAHALAGAQVDHYHQAIALVVANTFEQALTAAALIRVEYVRTAGAFGLAAAKESAPMSRPGKFSPPPETAIGDFEGAFGRAPVQLDANTRHRIRPTP